MNDFVDCYQAIDASDAFKDYLKNMVFKTLDFYYDHYQCERGMANAFCSVRIYSQLKIAVWLTKASHMKFRKLLDRFLCHWFYYDNQSWQKLKWL